MQLSLDGSLKNITMEVTDPKPTFEQYDNIGNDRRANDKVTKFLGLFYSKRFQTGYTAGQEKTPRD